MMAATTRIQKGRGFLPSTESQDMAADSNPRAVYFSPSQSITAASSAPAKSVEGWIIVATGIHEEAQEDTLIDKFAEYGHVLNIHLNLDRRTGFVKGYCLVEYGSFEEAQAAVAALDGACVYDLVVSVSFAF
eukprot:Partr_v1_DN23401_c0_g2_i1_m52502 putative RNA binding motif protein 8A